MAFPDYGQTSADHRRGLLLILPVGSRLTSGQFSKIRDRITTVSKVSVPSNASAPSQISSGNLELNPDAPPRLFRVRYTNNHPLENNEWGEFQYHRSLIGLICVGGYSTPQELCELSRLHDVAKGKYGKTLLDTRLVAIGVNSEGENQNGDKNEDAGMIFLNVYRASSLRAPPKLARRTK